jgi:hypothetical protein
VAELERHRTLPTRTAIWILQTPRPLTLRTELPPSRAASL